MNQEYGFIPYYFNDEIQDFVKMNEMVGSFLQAVRMIDRESGLGYILVYRLAENYPPQPGVIIPQDDQIVGYFPVRKKKQS